MLAEIAIVFDQQHEARRRLHFLQLWVIIVIKPRFEDSENS